MCAVQGDEGAADCLIWRNASKEYKRQAKDLDDQMRELIMLAKVAKRMVKAVIKVCKRGSRQGMYDDSDLKHMLESTLLDKEKLAKDQILHDEMAATAAKAAIAKAATSPVKKRNVWKGIRVVTRMGMGPQRTNSMIAMPRRDSVTESRTTSAASMPRRDSLIDSVMGRTTSAASVSSRRDSVMGRLRRINSRPAILSPDSQAEDVLPNIPPEPNDGFSRKVSLVDQIQTLVQPPAGDDGRSTQSNTDQPLGDSTSPVTLE